VACRDEALCEGGFAANEKIFSSELSALSYELPRIGICNYLLTQIDLYYYRNILFDT
jgi:hypothetical protein